MRCLLTSLLLATCALAWRWDAVQDGPEPPLGLSSCDTIFVFGLGTGRVGSVSLSRLLQAQEVGGGRRPAVTHEARPLLPWSLGDDPAQAAVTARRRLALLAARAARVRERSSGWRVHAGDVASWTLPLVPALLAADQCVVAVLLQRERADVVRSFAAKSGAADYWRPGNASAEAAADESFWAPFFPQFGNESSKEAAIGAYWDYYAAEGARLAALWPDRVRVFDSPACLRGREAWAMLRFAGYERPLVPDEPFHENAGPRGGGRRDARRRAPDLRAAAVVRAA